MQILRLVLLALALALAAGLGLRLAGAPPPALLAQWLHAVLAPEPAAPPQQPAIAQTAALAQPLAPASLRARLEARVATAPAFESYFAVLRQRFPSEFPALLDAISQPRANGPGNLDEDVANAMRRLRRTHGILAARAGLAAMERIPQAQLAILRAMEPGDKRLCADYFYGSGTAGFFGFSARNRELVAALAIANAEAIADGRARAATPPEAADADVQLFDDDLAARGLSRAEIETLLDSKIAEPPLDDASLCHAGIVYFESLLSLPEASKLRLLARLVALAARS